MSALTLELKNFVEQEIYCCRFCHCSERKPCEIDIAVNEDGTERLARTALEVEETRPCGWYMVGVCNAPECIEKLLEEKRGKVLLFDAAGHTLRRAEGR